MTPLQAQDSTFKLMRLQEKFGVICSFLAAFICVPQKKNHQLLKFLVIYKSISKWHQNNSLPA